MKRPCYILCVAGQSNAVGYDESPIPEDYTQRLGDARIQQLGFYGEDNLKRIPLGACAQNYQDLRPFGHPDSAEPGTRGIHLPLAHLLLPVVPPEFDLVVLPCAYGGTGFTEGEEGTYDSSAMRPGSGRLQWGDKSPFFLAMVDRIRFLLDQHPDSRFFRMVWCQGEQDWSDPAVHQAGFERMTDAFFSLLRQSHPGRVICGNWDRGIWFNLESTHYWYTFPGCVKIWEQYRQWNPDTYIPVPRETTTNAVDGTGKTARIRDAHFGANAFERVIAPLAAERILAAMGKA